MNLFLLYKDSLLEKSREEENKFPKFVGYITRHNATFGIRVLTRNLD